MPFTALGPAAKALLVFEQPRKIAFPGEHRIEAGVIAADEDAACLLGWKPVLAFSVRKALPVRDSSVIAAQLAAR